MGKVKVFRAECRAIKPSLECATSKIQQRNPEELAKRCANYQLYQKLGETLNNKSMCQFKCELTLEKYI